MPPIRFFFPDEEEEDLSKDEASKNVFPEQFGSEALRLVFRQKYNKANFYFQKSLQVLKDNVTTLSNRSYCNFKLGNVKRAMRDIDLVLQQQPKNISALQQKADIFFAMGKLEMALTYFYRVRVLGPKLKRPHLWIYICHTAIVQIIGDHMMELTTEGDLQFLQKQIDEDKISNTTKPFQARKKAAGGKKEDNITFDSITDISKNRGLVNLMGNLYHDRLHIERMFKDADPESRLGRKIRQESYAIIEFIDKQVIRMLHEKPPGDCIRRQAARPSIAQQRDLLNLSVTRELTIVDLEQREGRYEESLERAEVLLREVLEQTKGFIRNLEEVIATIYGYMGNAYVKTNDLHKALTFFRKEKDLSNRHNLENTKLHSLYYIGVVNVLQGNFKKATNIWNIRLSYAKNAEERCWLLHEIGRCYYALEDFERAQVLSSKALQEAQGLSNQNWLLNCQVLHAQIKVHLLEFDAAIVNYNLALDIATSFKDEALIESIEKAIRDLNNTILLSNDENYFLRRSDTEEAVKHASAQTKKTEYHMADEMLKQETAFMPDPDESCEGEGKEGDVGDKKKPPEGNVEADLFPAVYTDKMYRRYFGNYSRLTEEKFAFVTMATNNTYAVGALVLAETLKQVETKHDLVVMVTDEVDASMLELLKESFDLVKIVNLIDSQDKEKLSLLEREDLGITFTKLHAWRLVQYDKCVFIDADAIVLRNIDDLFDREAFSAAPDSGWPDCFNSGVFLYQPSNEMFKDLLDFAFKVGSFDGGDQGLLNLFFSDWASKDIKLHLPVTYNLPWHSYYSYKPALKHFGDQVKVLHFIGNPKPWTFGWDPIFQRVICLPEPTVQNSELLQLWWDVFMTSVQKKLPKDIPGIVGTLSKLKVRSLASQSEFFLRERQRQYSWEDNVIDYLGDDAFENIQKKLDEVMESEDTTKGPIRCLKLTTLTDVSMADNSEFLSKKDC